ncbi:MAG TPA: nucleoside monophosphate kinase [Candidatus Paceibacterota bacterium]
MVKKPVIFFLGKSGSGKDTQAELLIKKFGFNFISSGGLLREFKSHAVTFPEDSLERYEADGIKRILDAGKFVPTLTVACQWRFVALEIMKNHDKSTGLVFGGSPRKLAEAMILDDFFKNWPEAAEHFEIKPIVLALSDEDAKKRLLLRGREDDNEEAIKSRLAEFEEFVFPVIQYFKCDSHNIVKGSQSVEKVHEDVLKVLGL